MIWLKTGADGGVVKRVVVTGASGFVGARLAEALLDRGDSVIAPTRRQRDASSDRMRWVQWDARSPEPLSEVLAGVDAVVHLAGEQAVGRRWTADVKERIVSSRVDSTAALVKAMARAERAPAAFVCASAVGYYGPRAGDRELNEHAEPGDDFLARLCVHWEREAAAAAELGVRVVHARLGIVLGAGGGALAEMVKPFKVFAGGPIGDGRQVVSWVHERDAVRALMHAIDSTELEGPMNVTAPAPVTNERLARAIGAVLGRPASVRAPAFALRLRFGEGADPLLTGQRAVPKALLDSGFEFRYPEVGAALAEALAGSG